MRILLANNHYYVRGGAEKVFFDEIDLLKEKGHYIKPFSYNDINSVKNYHYENDMIDGFCDNVLKNFINIFWNQTAHKKIIEVIKKNKIQIFHGHNIHTRLSPSILIGAKGLGLKTFITIHDFKYVCPQYLMLKKNQICESCKDGKYYNAIFGKCHKDSYIKSTIVATELYNFKRIKLNEYVNSFISPSKFHLMKYKEMGFTGKIVHIPNFIESHDGIDNNHVNKGNFIFVGRLSPEKGIIVLLQAFKNNNFKLDIVGTGPLEKDIKNFIEKNKMSNRIILHGHLPTKKVLEKVLLSKALILPSTCYENAPISILEALSYGKIVLASNLGGIPEMIQDGKNGYLFSPNSPEDINMAIEKFNSLSNTEYNNFIKYSKYLINTVFSKENHYNKLMELYENG